MKRWLLAVLTVFTLVGAATPAPLRANVPALLARATVDETDTRVEVLTETHGNRVAFYVRNNLTWDVTIVVRVELENMESDQELPYRATIAGGKRVKAFALWHPSDARWHYRWNSHWVYGTTEAHHDDGCVYALPYASGTRHHIIQGFNGKFSHFGDQANAIDFQFAEGTEVLAARGGVVVGIQDGNTEGGPDKRLMEHANFVIVRHADGTFGEYLHLQNGGIRVTLGQEVAAGAVLGRSGNTGYTTGPHLHFMVYRAANGDHRESFPVRFKVDGQDDPVTLEQGEEYQAP